MSFRAFDFWSRVVIMLYLLQNQGESQAMVAKPPANIRTGKYHSALYNMPAVAPKKTRTLVSLSVIAF